MVGIPGPVNHPFRYSGITTGMITDGTVATADVSTTLFYGMTAKTSPVSADSVPIVDSAASNVNKKATIANLTKALGISSVTAKTAVVAADAVLVNDSEASNVAKSCTLTNLQKTLGEIAAGTNATSGLSEVDGVLRVNINSTTAKTSPVGADAVMINDSAASNVNKSCTLTNLVNMIAGTVTSTGLDDTTGVLTVRPLGCTAKTTPVGADGFIIGDSAASNAPKTVTLTQLGTVLAGTGLTNTTGTLTPNFHALTAKTTAVDNDEFAMVDSAASNASKIITFANLKTQLAGDMAGTVTATGIDDATGVITVRPLGCTAKATPVGADGFIIGDSADSNNPKTTTLTELGTVLAGTGLTNTTGTLTPNLHALTAKTSLVDADEVVMTDSAASNASKIITWANAKVQLATDVMSYTDWQTVIPFATGGAESGTWTLTSTSNVVTLVRTANAATEYFYAPIILPNRTTASKGVKLTSVDVAYTLNSTDTTNDDLEIRILKNAVGVDGVATAGTLLAGDDDADYDEAHNTKAERLDATGGPELHTASVTIPVGEQAFCNDNETYWLEIVVKDNAGDDLALIVTGGVANFTEVLA